VAFRQMCLAGGIDVEVEIGSEGAPSGTITAQ